MRKLNASQFKVLADFSNYIAVAWLTGGVVTPILTAPNALLQNVPIVIGGTIMSTVFLFLSLTISKKIILL